MVIFRRNSNDTDAIEIITRTKLGTTTVWGMIYCDFFHDAELDGLLNLLKNNVEVECELVIKGV